MSEDRQAYTDGPNTHKFTDYHRGTRFGVVSTVDVDGVAHHFHVPQEVTDALATPEPAPDVSAAWEALLGDDHIYASSAFRRDAIARHRPRIEAALRHAPDLDVERLARALEATLQDAVMAGPGGIREFGDERTSYWRDRGEAVAAAYAALRDSP